jgi:hypothetical protein
MTTVANDQIVFIHIPKTGGTWVSEAMERAGVKAEKFGNGPHPELPSLDLEGRFAFAFVREPLSWYRSVWAFHRRFSQSDWPELGEWIDLDFPAFIDRMAENSPGYLSSHYTGFVGPANDEISFIGRYEHLADDLVTALHMAGQDFDEQTLRSVPARNFENEESMYGSMLPPPDRSALPTDCPADVRARLIESEREIYDRFYSEEAATAENGNDGGRRRA